MGDLMSATEVLARLRIDAASEDFEGAQLGPVAVRKLLKHIAALESDRWRQLCRIHSNRADALRRERDELAEKLAEISAQPPVAWIEHELQGTGQQHLHFTRRPNQLRDDVIAPVWTELITRPAQACKPEQASMSLDDALELHAIADDTKIRPACDWPGKCKYQLPSHRKKN